jgi:hypothetical protein
VADHKHKWDEIALGVEGCRCGARRSPMPADKLMLARTLGNDLRNEIARIVCDADMGVKRDGLLGRHYLAADRIFDAISRASQEADV